MRLDEERTSFVLGLEFRTLIILKHTFLEFVSQNLFFPSCFGFLNRFRIFQFYRTYVFGVFCEFLSVTKQSALHAKLVCTSFKKIQFCFYDKIPAKDSRYREIKHCFRCTCVAKLWRPPVASIRSLTHSLTHSLIHSLTHSSLIKNLNRLLTVFDQTIHRYQRRINVTKKSNICVTRFCNFYYRIILHYIIVTRFQPKKGNILI